MPKTLQLIQSQTLTGTAASITFSNIPQNFTDLLIKFSGRGTRSEMASNTLISFNGSTSNFTGRYLEGLGSGTPNSSTYARFIGAISAGSATSSTFGSIEVYIPNYAGNANKSFSAEGVSENNATLAAIELNTGLWSDTSAITSITLSSGSSDNFVQFSTATLYGISGAKASGGTITYDGTYTYHTFTSTGNFTALEKIKGAEVLVVAGGGAGGGNSGGGGGAGGFRYLLAQTLNAGNTYTALVGAGGAGAAGSNNLRGNNGSNSVLGNISATGGGGGGNRGGGSPIGNGASGGSGGGGSVDGYVGGSGNAGGYSPVEGYAGGDSPGGTNPGGGGGGAGGVGEVGGSTNTSGGDGGIGSSLLSSWHSITGTGVLSGGVYYIAGGGGGSWNNSASGDGGLGGGGANGKANNSNGVAGTANTGGGGGAATGINTTTGGSGGSGLIIVRYPTN